jgi:hypothetical protein
MSLAEQYCRVELCPTMEEFIAMTDGHVPEMLFETVLETIY